MTVQKVCTQFEQKYEIIWFTVMTCVISFDMSLNVGEIDTLSASEAADIT